VKFAFIRDHLSGFEVEAACRVLQVSRSGLYAWLKRSPSARHRRRDGLAVHIRAVHADNRRVYGSPRICKAMNDEGHRISVNTVARIMRDEGIRAKAKRAFVPRTTDSCHDRPVAPNLLGRQFDADRCNSKWAADITYVPTDEGWLYVAGVLDLHSRRLVGWSMADHMETSLVSDALGMALARRQVSKGLVHHSDRGVQYASLQYQALLEKHGITVSMSGKGDCYDNAMMESFWSTLKTELVHLDCYATRQQARQSIFDYIETFYNRTRLHSSLGYVSPEAFEAAGN
jgi:transposase InsO family protein